MLHLFCFASAALHVEFGPDVPAGAAKAVTARLAPHVQNFVDEDLFLSIGRTLACVPAIISPAELSAVDSEGFIVARRGRFVCAVGNPSAFSSNNSIGSALAVSNVSSIGSAFAAYHILEQLGFAFLHPLAATIPAVLNTSAIIADGQREVQSPALRFRGFHVHTEHPLELVEVLQGSSASLPNGSIIPWATMLPDVSSLCEWLIANRQNHLQWILLAAPEWRSSGWVNSTERQTRLRALTELAQSFGLRAGADIPIAEVQQRAWYMVERYDAKDVPSMIHQIASRLDWVLGGAGFDYLASESGTSEFTHPDCTTMLALISATSDHAAHAHGKRSYIKCHASTGQSCPTIPDPRDGTPLNFNFLPMLASKTMGVLPHTIQAYSLDDPTDGAYGNADFYALRDFMLWEAANDTAGREVVFHPETNYWVNVDIDVPLFIPLAGERRLHDLRGIAFDEDDAAVPKPRRVSGQLIFDSGWEWGSWLSDVVAARSSWDPLIKALPKGTPAQDVHAAAVRPIAEALLGGSTPAAAQLSMLIARLAQAQHTLLTLGAPSSGFPPPSPSELQEASGWGLLSGRDAWTDLLQLVGVARTQPGRLGFHDHKHALYPRVAPLAAAMNATFGQIAAELATLAAGALAGAATQGAPRHTISTGAPQAPRGSSAVSLLSELAESASLLAMRAEFVALLYAATAPHVPSPASKAAFASARAVLSRAAAAVAMREAAYRVDAQRVGGWRDNPTAYSFGYLWTVHSLYYWWRDLGQAERGSAEAALSPCYLNTQFPYDVVLGGGRNLSSWLREYVRGHVPIAGHALGDCLAPPQREYVFPRDLYAYGAAAEGVAGAVSK